MKVIVEMQFDFKDFDKIKLEDKFGIIEVAILEGARLMNSHANVSRIKVDDVEERKNVK